MNKKQSKRQRDIKTKLMAAICMLLVSSIMMVSTTYAWFTLSTAPEVTGINTAVGANGNLEMALMPTDGQVTSIKSEVGDSDLDKEKRNVTWGNLVDLSMEGNQSIYGLDKITLYPAALSLTADGKVNVLGSILKTPQYGADGRVSQLADNSTVGYFDKQTQTFSPNELKGVRAVGSASGMTPRQLDYRNARSAANTARAMAANLAAQSLNNNGSALANIAIKYGMNQADAEFTATDVASLRAIINDLQKEGGILDQIETAYMQYILAYAASATSGEAETVWQAVKGAVNAENATIDSVTGVLTSNGVSLPGQLTTAIDHYKGMVTDVAQADTDLKTLEAGTEPFSWAQISTPMRPLADPTAMKINGFKASEVKQNLSALVSSVTTQGGLKVIMETGAGVYADIADQSGDYNASITIEKVEYNGIALENMTARMETASTVNPSHLNAIGTVVAGAGAPATGSTTLPITDMYGYIIDLAFRTNATESKLLLQQDATDRIYGDENTNEETMGHGASMTFMATTTDFGNEQVKGLMNAINLVFFNPADGTIYCYGGLDTANATTGTDGITAKIYLYTNNATATTTYNKATYDPGATDVTYYKLDTDGTTYVSVTDAAAESAAGTQLYTATTTAAGKQEITDNAIMALTQNQPQALSVLVYLNGEQVTNANVAATGSTSMTGKMNLQFSSSANLVPMEYADLYIPGAASGSGGTTETQAPTETQATNP